MYLRFSSKNSSIAATRLSGKSSKASYIKCIIVVSKSLESWYKLFKDISKSSSIDEKSLISVVKSYKLG
jgi:hypothetical protein